MQGEAAPSLPAVPILLRQGGGLLRAPGPPEGKARAALHFPWREDSAGSGGPWALYAQPGFKRQVCPLVSGHGTPGQVTQLP